MGATELFAAPLPSGTPGDLADLAEIDRYADAVNAFRDGGIPEDRFTAARLQQGCYGQRQPGVNMLRIKAPGGRLDADKLDAIAGVVSTYVDHERRIRSAYAHITTANRSDPLGASRAHAHDSDARSRARGPDDAREAANTVRNMTACPWRRLPERATDINRHLEYAAHYFLRNPLTSSCRASSRSASPRAKATARRACCTILGVVAR